jgi:hypothetical protein
MTPGWAPRWSWRRLAALAWLVPFATLGGIWYTFLFVASPPGSDRLSLLSDWLLRDPQRLLFRELAILPLFCLALSVAHLSPWSVRPRVAWVLVAVGFGVAVRAWLTLDTSIAAAMSLPLAFAAPAAGWATWRGSAPS